MRTTSPVILAACVAGLLAGCAGGGEEAKLLATVRTAYPSTHFDRVLSTPVPGMYEVWMSGNVAYMSASAPRYMLFGRLVDVRTMRDLTAPKLQRAEAGMADTGAQEPAPVVRPAELPLGDAIKTVQGNGRRTLVIFTDPHCGYCRQLDEALRQVHDVTVYNFMLPFQGHDWPVSIWCARDRAAAWHGAMAGGVEPVAAVAGACPHPIDRNLALARHLGIQGTPTLIFSDGRVAAGALEAQDIEARLALSDTTHNGAVAP